MLYVNLETSALVLFLNVHIALNVFETMQKYKINLFPRGWHYIDATHVEHVCFFSGPELMCTKTFA